MTCNVCIYIIYIRMYISDSRNTEFLNLIEARDKRNIYAVMKTLCPPSMMHGYQHDGFDASHALLHEFPQSHHSDNR